MNPNHAKFPLSPNQIVGMKQKAVAKRIRSSFQVIAKYRYVTIFAETCVYIVQQ